MLPRLITLSVLFTLNSRSSIRSGLAGNSKKSNLDAMFSSRLPEQISFKMESVSKVDTNELEPASLAEIPSLDKTAKYRYQAPFRPEHV